MKLLLASFITGAAAAAPASTTWAAYTSDKENFLAKNMAENMIANAEAKEATLHDVTILVEKMFMQNEASTTLSQLNAAGTLDAVHAITKFAFAMAYHDYKPADVSVTYTSCSTASRRSLSEEGQPAQPRATAAASDKKSTIAATVKLMGLSKANADKLNEASKTDGAALTLCKGDISTTGAPAKYLAETIAASSDIEIGASVGAAGAKKVTAQTAEAWVCTADFAVSASDYTSGYTAAAAAEACKAATSSASASSPTSASWASFKPLLAGVAGVVLAMFA